MPTVTCSSCGGPVADTPELAELLDRTPPGALISILCGTCADAASIASRIPPARTFRVGLVIAELVDTVPTGMDEDGNPVGEEEVWEDVGGFQLKGQSATVRGFAVDIADAFQARLETLLNLADADPGPPPVPTADELMDDSPDDGPDNGPDDDDEPVDGEIV